MEVRGLISYSAAASLAVSLVLRPFWSLVATRMKDPQWRRATTVGETAYIGGHLLAGALLGMLFWLSWGFVAMVSLSWWQRGLVFGAATGVLCTLPWIVIAVSLRRETPSLYVLLFTEAFVTALACGLTCSYYWANAAW